MKIKELSRKLNENTSINFFRTSDLPLVATLQLNGYQIDSLDRSNPSRVVFVIERNGTLDKLLQDYWARKLRVEPLGFFESLKSLKTRIYQQ